MLGHRLSATSFLAALFAKNDVGGLAGHAARLQREPVRMPNVVCMHEVDQGMGWKHTNVRNGCSTVARDRRLVIQCTATVAKYEYILAFILDQAANLHIEVKATGIVSTMPIRKGLHVPWGTAVAPGVLAANHQHLFCVRIDPNLDGQRNTIQYDDCEAVHFSSLLNDMQNIVIMNRVPKSSITL